MNRLPVPRSGWRRPLTLLAALMILGAWARPANAQPLLIPSIKRIHTDLHNFKLRVPWNIPVNDVVIVIYGVFPNGINDVVKTYHNPDWGSPEISYVPGWKGHPLHAGFGLDQLIVRYGPGPEATPGDLMHFGVHLRPCRFHVHVEAWWTYNGYPVARAWLCHIYKIRVRHAWLVRVSNPRVWDPEFPDAPLHLYGARYFIPDPATLPRLDDLVIEMDPGQFGGSDWTLLQDGDQYGPSLELAPDAVLTFVIPNPNDDPTPPIFQVALRQEPSETAGPPNPDDPFTLAVSTDRAAQEFMGDMNGDGAVGPPDFNILRGQYLLESVDNNE